MFIGHKNQEVGFTLIELLIVVVIIGILSAVAVPMYSRFVIEAKAAEVHQSMSAILTYLKGFQRAHDGNGPSGECDTTEHNGEWIDDVLGANSRYFDYYYKKSISWTFTTWDGKTISGTMSLPTPWHHLYVEGKAKPFGSSDVAYYFYNIDSWYYYGQLEGIAAN